MQSIAVVPYGMTIDPAEMAAVVSAIQIQLIRDFSPKWKISAACTAFQSPDQVPDGYWFAYVVPDAKGRAGYHHPKTTKEAPFAVVQYASGLAWSVAASHEILEMLVDPRGDLRYSGPNPKNPAIQAQYLAEICDPCQSNSYHVDNNHPAAVSDFCLPSFYGLGTDGPPYTVRGNVHTPFWVGDGGALAYLDQGKWFQLSAISGPPVIVPVDPADVLGTEGELTNFRGEMDRRLGRYAGPPLPNPQSAAVKKYSAIRKAAEKKVLARNKALERRLAEMGL